jgi:hypothetical protein
VTPLSFAQERLWFLHAAAPDSAGYNVPLLVPCDGALAPETLAEALRHLVTRHDVLRTYYPAQDGVPVQSVADGWTVPLRIVDLTGTPGPRQVAGRQAVEEASRPFDLRRTPPLRCVLWQGAPDGDLLLLGLHHIAVDGWSLPLLLDDLWACYAAVRDGTPMRPRRPQPQFADCAVRERELAETAEAEALLRGRVEQLRPYPVELRLGPPPTATPGSAPGRAGRAPFVLPERMAEALHRQARALRTTPFVLLLAAFQEVVRRYAGTPRFLIGTAMANRPDPELEKVIGMFAGTVPLRCAVRPEAAFAELCAATGDELSAAFDCQGLPYDRLVRELTPYRAAGRRLVQIGFSLQTGAAALAGPGQRPPELLFPEGESKFDLSLYCDIGPDEVAGGIEYDTHLYSAALAQGVRDAVLTLLDSALEDPRRPLAGLPLTPDGPGALRRGTAGEPIDLVAEHRDRLAAVRKAR